MMPDELIIVLSRTGPDVPIGQPCPHLSACSSLDRVDVPGQLKRTQWLGPDLQLDPHAASTDGDVGVRRPGVDYTLTRFDADAMPRPRRPDLLPEVPLSHRPRPVVDRLGLPVAHPFPL